MISSGAKRDLMVLQFCKALLDVSKQDETISDTDVASRGKVDYHLNKRIDRALEKLSKRLQATITSLYEEGGKDLAKWSNSNLASRIGTTLTNIQAKTINLEMLALWVLFVNFSERDKAVHPAYSEWLEPNQYFRIIELMGGTEVAVLEGELFEISYDVVRWIKK
jgi:hypothetical protein